MVPAGGLLLSVEAVPNGGGEILTAGI
jgi:hypothetical protein